MGSTLGSLPSGCKCGFNSSQVGYKRSGCMFLRWHSSGFNSSQVGYKLQRSQALLPIDFVSIPHRQATNLPRVSKSIKPEPGFQFLIGRLQTGISHIATVVTSGFNSSQVGYKLFKSVVLPLPVCRFNSSQVGYKPKIARTPTLASVEFQFLIGRLQTGTLPVKINPTIVFQFLIGRLQTVASGIFPPAQAGFQFLIGRLQTKKPLHGTGLILLFQFLIGRLQTRPGQCRDYGLCQVSIPHRQATNKIIGGYVP